MRVHNVASCRTALANGAARSTSIWNAHLGQQGAVGALKVDVRARLGCKRSAGDRQQQQRAKGHCLQVLGDWSGSPTLVGVRGGGKERRWSVGELPGLMYAPR